MSKSSTGSGQTNVEIQWTPSSMTPTQINVFANDSKQAFSSNLAVAIYMCAGCSDHGDCDFVNTVASNISTFYTTQCDCFVGWGGINCDVDIDGCLYSPCPTGTTCTDNSPEDHRLTGNAFRCSDCPAGYNLINGTKCTDVNECTSTTLPHNCNQTCTNTEGSFLCSCDVGYRSSGSDCIDIDECQEGTADCQQICSNTPGSFKCSCLSGYNLDANQKTCTEVSKPPDCNALNCEQGCTTNSTDHAYCFCDIGYTLNADQRTCSDENECLTGSQCNHLCNNTLGGFECRCYIGYKLQSDKKSCQACDSVTWGYECNTTCSCTQNSVRCDNVKGCICKDGWEGQYCQTDINECNTTSGICEFSLETCVNTLGSYSCRCQTGYERNATTNLCQDIDECASSGSHSCSSTQDCVNTLGSFQCVCKSGYSRNSTGACIDVDECALGISECQHYCLNTDGSYSCRCRIGYLLQDDRRNCMASINRCLGSDLDKVCDKQNGGCSVNATDHPYCFCDAGYVINETNGVSCNDVDECATGEANCSGTCVNSVGGFTCSCSAGSKLNADGKTCDNCADTDTWGVDCVNICNCGPGASNCDPLSGCQCKAGYNGTYCDDINECNQVPAPCDTKVHSTCINTDGSYICRCNDGYTENAGVCEDIDECATNQFDCNQRCVNTEGSYECACRDGYQLQSDGKTCLNIDECSLGTDNCEQQCLDAQGSFLCTCYPGFNLATDLKSCIKDPNFDPCTNAGVPRNCSYACRLVGTESQCYCPLDFKLDPTDNSSCLALNNTIVGHITTNFTFTSDLNDPSSAEYKNLKSDFENLVLSPIFNNVTGFQGAVVTSFDTGSTRVNFDVIFADDITAQTELGVANALVGVKGEGFSIGDTKYAILTEPRMNDIYEPATCITCLSNETCVILTDGKYHCRSDADSAKSLFLRFTLNKDYQEGFSDPLNITFANYALQIISSISSVIQPVQLESILVVNFTNVNSNTEVIVALSFNVTYSEATKIEVAREVVTGIDDVGCLDVSGNCISLIGQTYLGDTVGTLGPTICLICSSTQQCTENQGLYSCVDIPTTTVTTAIPETTTTGTSNLDLILGLGIGVPLGILFFVIMLMLILYCCRKRRGSSTQSSISEDPWNLRKAFGTFDSRISGKSLEGDEWVRGGGNFFGGPYLRNWEQSRNIVDSYPYQGEASPRDETLRVDPDWYHGASNFDSSHDEGYLGERREPPGDPESNFSWDFLFHRLNPKEEFKIQRPTVEQRPTKIYQDMSDA